MFNVYITVVLLHVKNNKKKLLINYLAFLHLQNFKKKIILFYFLELKKIIFFLLKVKE